MKKYVIISDMNSDLSNEIREEYDLMNVINSYYTTPDGKEYKSSLDWSGIDEEGFYNAVRKGAKYTTSPANIEDYKNYFEGFLKEGYDILSISLSGGMSVTYNNTLKAKEELEALYPNNKIYVVDSRRYSAAFGLLVIAAANLKKEGKSIEEVYSWVEENKNRVHQMGSLDDLNYLARRGRISNAKAFFGTLIGIKPMGDFDSNGMPLVLSKVKGFNNVYKFVVEYLKRTGIDPVNQAVFIANSNRKAQALELKKVVEDNFNPNKLYMVDLSISTAINTGPGLLAVYYFGNPLSENLEEEKKIVREIEELV